jgi:hypothetical protein
MKIRTASALNADSIKHLGDASITHTKWLNDVTNEMRRENRELRQENADLQFWVNHAIENIRALDARVRELEAKLADA